MSTITVENPQSEYAEFLARKSISAPNFGFDVPEEWLNPALFPFQAHIVIWALRRGRAAIFADCGTGKTLMQLVWSQCCYRYTGKPSLIVAPLAVAQQTAREAERFGIPITICRTQADVRPGINITNYEMLQHFDAEAFGAIALDESSILKSFMGKIKQMILSMFATTEFRSAWTATPAPNDYLELGNHAEFLGVMRSNEMIMRWFINDTMAAGSYRLKGHAAADFWRWVCSWAVSLSTPADLGFDATGYELPELSITSCIVDSDVKPIGGQLMQIGRLSATELHKVKRQTAGDRAAKAAELVADYPDTPWVLWCDTDYEADAICAAIPEAVNLKGGEPLARKEQKLIDFAEGRIRVLVTKPKIGGFGMNWQHCCRTIFVGLSYSYEMFYQALRRFWRFGQQYAVSCFVLMSEEEQDLLTTILRKQGGHEIMKREMIAAMKQAHDIECGSRGIRTEIETETAEGRSWTLHLGDACQEIHRIESESVGLTVTSPPFQNLYIYSDSIADMGNCKDGKEFRRHMWFLARELYRVTMPGRLCAIHCKDLPLYKGRDGAAGLVDFPGAIERLFRRSGWTYHSRVTIWKDPVIEMQRTKNHGLLYSNLLENSCVSRQGMADYLLVFRKWHEGMESLAINPVAHSREGFSLDQWQKWASPVWMDIDQTRVLNYQLAKEGNDEKHICPLQLDVIDRSIILWSNPGDLVFDPFNGIGSTGVEAVKFGRRYIGTELKRGYFDIAARNLKNAESSLLSLDLFAEV